MAARSKPLRFDPQSFDAQFAEVRVTLKNHSDLLQNILRETKFTNGRVTANDERITIIEGKRRWLIGWVAGASSAAGILTGIIAKLVH